MLQPILDRVAIEPLPELYEGKIVLPVARKTKTRKGIIRGIGAGVKEPGLKIGDKVLFHLHPNIKSFLRRGVFLIRVQEVLGTMNG